MKTFTVERSLMLGGTDYGKRLVAAIVTHPEIVEVLETSVVGAGKEGGYAANIRIVYRAERSLDWWELTTVCRDVPLYTPVDPEVLRKLREWEARQ